jgi:hypothetical protein
MTQGDAHELQAFGRLQQRLWPLYAAVGNQGPRVVVVVPSVGLDGDELRKIPGMIHYEERLLFTMQLLRDPDTRIIYVTNRRLHPTVIEYALDTITSLPNSHARRRLTFLDCADGDSVPLARKVLGRPDLIEQIRRGVSGSSQACLVVYAGGASERTLAVRLGIPLYACDPALSDLGSKSGARRFFRAAGIPVPEGYEDLRDEGDLIQAVAELKTANPKVCGAVIKLNDSFAGGGNGLFSFADAPDVGLRDWVKRELPQRVEFGAGTDTWESYMAKWREMGGVVERYVDAAETRSPAAQLDITPTGEVRVLTTHDQILGGAVKQVFVASTFPAHPSYRMDIQELASRAGEALADKSVLGLLSIDFVSERTPAGWSHYALETNMRMGGGTTPYFHLHGLVEGEYNRHLAEYLSPEGESRCYFASDRLQRDEYRMFGPDEVIDIALRHGLGYSNATRYGAIFYMLGGTARTGKVGIIAIHRNPECARRTYDGVVAALDAEVLSRQRT